MAVDKNHPDYPIYSAKHKAIWDYYWSLIEAEEERLKVERPNWMNCKDGLASAQKSQFYRKMSAEIRILREEYAYLFTKSPPDDQDDPGDIWPDETLLSSLR